MGSTARRLEGKREVVGVLRVAATAKCSRCALGDLCFSKGLSKAALRELDHQIHRSGPLPRGTHLFRAGDELLAVYAVQFGCFKTYVLDEAGREHVLEFHLPGDLIGLDALYSTRHRCNALALGKASVCVLGCEDFSDVLRQIPGLDRRLLTLMSRDVANAQAMARYLSAEERIAAFLLDMSARLVRRGERGAEIHLEMPRRDIANYLGLATETVSRVLTQFKIDGLLQVQREHVRIANEEGLCQVARLVPSFLN